MMHDRCHLPNRPAGTWPAWAHQVEPPPPGAVRVLLERRKHAQLAQSPGCLIATVKGYAIFSFAEDGSALTCNAGVETLFGVAANEFIGGPVEPFFATDPEAATRHRELLVQVRNGAEVSHEQWMQRKDGTRFYAHWSMSWLDRTSGRAGCFVTILRDGTQAREQHEATRGALDATERFLSLLSHELRTPLHALLGWSQLMQASPGAELHQRAREAIHRNAQALTQVVNDLLDRDRITSGKMKLVSECIDIRELCLAAIDAVEPAARARGLQVSLHIPAELPELQGDTARLRQVLWNLLSNAVKFTPAGGTVSLEVRPCSRLVRFVVSDTGRGIAPSRLPHLFVSHFQVREGSAREDGLGLGLPIVQEIVLRHGGRVYAESAGENQGSTFVVELPQA